MRFLSPTLAASLLFLGLGGPVRAQDCQGCGGLSGAAAGGQQQAPVLEIDDGDDDEKTFGEIETQLNALLIVDESGAIVVRKEFADSLPIPAERVQQMLGQFIELGADGKIHIRDRDTVRPYLPMLQRFLGPDSMERMRQLQNLPPEQRRDAMRRMMQNPNGPTPAPTPAPAPTPRPEPRATPRPEPRQEPRQEPRARDDDRTRQLEQRLSSVEDSLKRMERLLERSLEQPRRAEGRDEAEPRRRGVLGGGDMMERARVWSRGLKKLREVTKPEDMEAIGRALARLREQVKPGDLRDRGALMEKLQESVDPADMGRMMEIFSEFLGTPEGRAMAEEVEKLVAHLEEMINSQGGQGQDRGLDGAMQRLEELLGRGGNGNDGGLREQLERLVRGRDARPEQRQEQRQGGEERLHREARPDAPAPRPRSDRSTDGQGRPRGLPEGARLY